MTDLIRNTIEQKEFFDLIFSTHIRIKQYSQA